jgi:MoCo/4Fe-4S cofactor protein with predicted Tat translocation signal
MNDAREIEDRGELPLGPARDGRRWWRGLEELAEPAGDAAALKREFPAGAERLDDPVGRREFLKLSTALLALAGLDGCARQPDEKIVPYVVQPEGLAPGKPLFFATSFVLQGFATGILVESNMGRPTKVEGNPRHPASLGATDAFAQASVLSLYDPDRSRTVLQDGANDSWAGFLKALAAKLEGLAARGGEGLRILTETVTSPTLASQLEALLRKYPAARWHQHQPGGLDAVREGARRAFGEPVSVRHRFDQAAVVLSLEADFLCEGPGRLRHTRDFMSRRRIEGPGPAEMNRLYVVESAPSPTGSVADHRLRLPSLEIEGLAWALARELGLGVEPPGPLPPAIGRWVAAAARDLKARRGAGIVVAGASQPPAVHELVHAMNHLLENAGRTVEYAEAVEARPIDQGESLRALAADLAGGRVEALILIGGNPAFTAPADLDLAGGIRRAPWSVHLGDAVDETSFLCHWHIPLAHDLEAWGDARAFDGTAGLIQPLIAPLHGGRSAHELVSALLGNAGRSGYESVREHWKARIAGGDFEERWRTALHDGLIEGTEHPPKAMKLREGIGSSGPGPRVPRPSGDGPLEITFRLDPTVGDGRFASNGWLQELPKPMTKITWDNTAWVSPASARRLGLSSGEVVELRVGGRSVEAPVWVMPGQADDSISVQLGYGRTRAGRAASGAGFNAYALLASTAPWSARGLELRRTGRRFPLACRQMEQTMAGRDLVRSGTLAGHLRDPGWVKELDPPLPGTSLYPPAPRGPYAWGMVIDLNVCTGCGACVTACQAENNIPVVGKDQVIRGRAMHWLRVDRYFKGPPEDPQMLQQVVVCMHCENAPCELVCPVEATVHSDEGLNQMVYNRCVGTRYCSNNCPYKVRRFNFLEFSFGKPEELRLVQNPQVTVRSRGVMEKCTYCIQRIQAAKIEAEKGDRRVRDGEVVTACQAVCPAQAIVFGDLDDPRSQVAGRKSSPLNYGLLTELNTRPRTTYLANLKNPNPEMGGA